MNLVLLYVVLLLKLPSIFLVAQCNNIVNLYFFIIWTFFRDWKIEKRKNIRDIGNWVEIEHPFCKDRWIHEYQKFVCLLTDGNLFHKFIIASHSGTFAKNMINFITWKSEYIYTKKKEIHFFSRLSILRFFGRKIMLIEFAQFNYLGSL